MKICDMPPKLCTRWILHRHGKQFTIHCIVLITRNDLSKHILTSDYNKTGSELHSSLNVHKIHTVEQAISTVRWEKWDKMATRD